MPVRLPPGATSARDLAISPDGRWAYVVHTIGRTNLPTTQLERGWVYTNALSIIDLSNNSLHATVLLDHLTEGAPNPWGVSLAPDGKTIYVDEDHLSIWGSEYLVSLFRPIIARELAGIGRVRPKR